MESLLELLSAGMTIDEVLADYPDLEHDDLLAALEFGALTAGRYRVIPSDAQIAELLALFEANLETIERALAEVDFVEIGPQSLVLHQCCTGVVSSDEQAQPPRSFAAGCGSVAGRVGRFLHPGCVDPVGVAHVLRWWYE